MEDKELYDFFKSRRNAFDEAPGALLWERISAALPESPEAQAEKPSRRLKNILWILTALLAAIALIWLLAVNPCQSHRQIQENNQQKTGELNVTNINVPAKPAAEIDSLHEKKTDARKDHSSVIELHVINQNKKTDRYKMISPSSILTDKPNDTSRTRPVVKPVAINLQAPHVWKIVPDTSKPLNPMYRPETIHFYNSAPFRQTKPTHVREVLIIAGDTLRSKP